jgi:type I restriction enzyme S subunit
MNNLTQRTMRPLPSGWEWRKLGKVAKIINGSTPDTNQPEFWDGDILWVTPTDVGRLTTIEIFDTERKITQAGLDSCSATMLPAGAVLMTSRAPVGNLAIAGKPLCTNQGFKSFVPKEGLNNRYLYFALQYFVPDLQKISHGNTFTEITKEMLMDFYVPIPIEEKEQQRIASCLEAQMAEAQRLHHAAERQLGSAISLPQNIVNHELITGHINE